LVKGNIYYVFFDNENNAWLSSDMGIYRVQLNRHSFKQYLSMPLQEYNIKYAFSCRSISVTGNELLVNSNLIDRYKINLQDGQKKKSFNSIEGHVLVPLIKTGSGEYYTASRELFHVKNGEAIQTYAWENQEELIIWSIYQDQNKKIWLGTDRFGLGIIQDGGLVRYNNYHKFDELEFSFFWEFLPWDKEQTLTATSEGLYLLHTTKGITHKLRTETDALIDSLHYLHIYRDKQQPNVIWGGTIEGLVRLTIDDSNWRITDYQHFTTADGLANNTIYAVYEDKHDNLWMPSDYGIICFNKKTLASTSYTTLDGVSFNEFNRESHFQDENGILYFGSMNGLTVFNPEEVLAIEKRKSAAPLRITSFQQFSGDNNKIEDKTIDLLRDGAVTLQPDDKFFNLGFSLLEFIDAKAIKYSYRISGQSDEWIYLNSNQLMVSGLPYGKHALEIRAQGVSGHFSKSLSIPISVLRPFYLQWWFVSLFCLTVLAIVYLWNRQRERRLRSRQVELEAEVQVRTQQIQEDKEIIEQQAVELKNLDAIKSNFFANISHELRTPLTLITSPVDAIIERNQLNTQDATHLQMVKRNGMRLKKMVDEILDLTKLEANKLELNPSTVIWSIFIKPILAGFESIADNRKINYHFEHQANQYLQIRLDKQKLEIIISNLLSNAFKFTQSGEILFSSAIENGLLSITVKDTGRGIHPDDLPHIFNRFFQTKNKEAVSEGGTGIGLALASELVKLMNGEMRVESKLGEGTSFYVEIPVVEVLGQLDSQKALEIEELQHAPAAIKADLTHHTATDENRPFILLVEDNYDLSQFIQSLLAGLYQVKAVEHGKAALEILNTDKAPDLIVSDVMMPIMDGFQLLENVKTNGKFQHIPFVMLTARSAISDKLKALRIGVDDYLTKPFINEELLVRIENLLNNATQRQSAVIEEVERPLPEMSEETKKWLDDLELYILSNIDNLQLNVDDLVEAMNTSKRQFYRQMKQLIGVTPNQYLKTFRLNYARKLLEEKSKDSVKAVAYAVGFSNVIYFSREFKKEFGRLPSDYLE